jgi:hypothetical protein
MSHAERDDVIDLYHILQHCLKRHTLIVVALYGNLIGRERFDAATHGDMYLVSQRSRE